MNTLIQRKIAEIMSLSYEVSSRTPYAVFLDYAGHVNSIDLRISSDKHCDAARVRLVKLCVYLDVRWESDAERLAQLDEMIAVLQRLMTP